ncbi:MAG: hypothetical protein JST14_13730 [Bacteroidetes bacterium]|nr:hypothetical protein [Bacteroidota bacterium]
MSKVKNNPIMKTLTGTLGRTVYFRMWRGRHIMASMPKRREKLSEKQEKTVSRFKLASAWAKQQMTDPKIKALYQARTNYHYHSAYLVALNDYLHQPEVKGIRTKDEFGSNNNTIFIDVLDDFEVVEVRVMIKDKSGKILESGNAQRADKNPNMWKYTPKAANLLKTGTIIQAIAVDRPGNEGSMETVI